MTTYVYRDGEWRDKQTGEPMERSDVIAMPAIRPDIAGYKSVATGKWVDGRTAQREDLKRSGCRLADPSEAPQTCRTEKWAKRLNMPHEPAPIPKRLNNWIGPIGPKE